MHQKPAEQWGSTSVVIGATGHHDAPVQKVAKRWDHRLSIECLAQADSPLKDSAKTLDPSRMIALGNGRPSPDYLPWEKFGISLSKSTTSDAQVPASHERPILCSKGEEGFDLVEALDYGLSTGSPKLIKYFTEHVKSIHNPPYKDWETCISCGSTSAIERALRMFCNRGDWIVTENYTYSGTITAAKAQGLKILGASMDQEGIIPDHLDVQLQNWDPLSGKKPTVLYTIPSGQNPTGATQSTERKRAIYQIAEKHDLLIVEDDPYFFLQLEAGISISPQEDGIQISPNEFQKALPSSYLSLDVSGRVLRLDSASKILAPGLRFGWVTGCAQLIDKYVTYADSSTLSASGPSQAVVYKTLCETWGHSGYMNWVARLSGQYRYRRDIMLDACLRHLPSKFCRWNIPTCGMFLWVQVDLSEHPQWHSRDSARDTSWQSDVEERIRQKVEDDGVMVAKGSWFFVGGEMPNQIFFRLTYVAAPKEDLDQAVYRLGQVLNSELI